MVDLTVSSRESLKSANVNGIVPGFTLDTADLLVDGRRISSVCDDDPLRLQRVAFGLSENPSSEAVGFNIDLAVDFEPVRILSGARLFSSYFLLGGDPQDFSAA